MDDHNGQSEEKQISAQKLVALLAETFENVRRRRTTLRAAHAVTALAGQLLKVIETADLEERIAEIEKRLDERDRTGGKGESVGIGRGDSSAAQKRWSL